MVDAGTVELVRSLGVEVATSAELVQAFEARWTPEALESHLEAGRRAERERAEGFAKAGMVTDHGPIVGVNANAANPHYEPTEDETSPIRAGDWVLLDMWAKLDHPGATYYDITWTAFCGDNPPEEMRSEERRV